MAKRKRSSTSLLDTPTNGGKRRREEAQTSSPHPHGTIDYDREYRLRAILDEKGDQYLIDWENDEETGHRFDPTWEPKANANQLAVDEWEERKRANEATAGPSAPPAKRGRGRPRKYPVGASPSLASPTTPAPVKRPRGRPRKIVINSSSTAPSPASKSTPQPGPAPAPSSSADDTEPPLEIEESDTEHPLIVDEDNPLLAARFEVESLQVQLSEPPSSYRAGAYEKLSSQASSTAPKSSSLNHSSSLSASQPLESVQNDLEYHNTAPLPLSQPISTQSGKDASLVIPDSQSQQAFDESSSFKGFSPDPGSRPASTAYSRAISERGHSPAATPAEQSRPSTSASIAFDSVPVSQATPARVAVAGAQEGERNAADAARSSNGNDQVIGISGQQHRSPDPSSQGAEEDASRSAPRSPVTSSAKHSSQGQKRNSDLITKSSLVQSQPIEPTSNSSKRRNSSETQFKRPPSSRSQSSAENNSTQAEQAETSLNDSRGATSVEDQIQDELSRSLATAKDTTSQDPISQQQTQATSDESHTQAGSVNDGANAERPIVVSSNEEGEQSPLRSLELFTQSSLLPDYEPPPAGQKPLPSSAVQHPSTAGNNASQPATAHLTSDFSRFWPSESRHNESQEQEAAPQQENPSQEQNSSSDQSSFPFQTQIRPAFDPFTGHTQGKEAGATTTSHAQHQSAAVLSAGSRGSTYSSPFPAVPSQSLAQVGESAPSHLRIPEDMAETPSQEESMASITAMPGNGGQSPKDDPQHARGIEVQKDRASRTLQVPGEQPASALPPSISAEVAAAQRAARLSIPPEGARSPSTVPAKEPVSEITREEQNTSERYDTLLPQAQSSSLRKETHSLNGTMAHTDSAPKQSQEPEKDPESANVHIVPVGLFGIPRDAYLQNLWLHDNMIKEFLQDPNPSEELLQQADDLFVRLRSIVMHPDLVNIEALSQVSTPDRQAQWDCNASTKFRFVKEFLGQQSGRDIHVALIVRGQTVSDMMETFLRGSHISYKTSYTSGQEHEEASKSGLRATIVDVSRSADHVESADVVIAMDGLIPYQDPTVRAYRKHSRRSDMSWANDWAGLYVLVAPHTIEHIERFIVPGLSRKARARTLLTAIDNFRDYFTKSTRGQSQLSLLKQAAQDVVDYLDDPEAEWPLEELSIIENLDSQTDSDPSSGQEHQSSGAKRPLDSPEIEVSVDASKRQRLETDAPTMPATINPQDVEITHVSDSLGKGTQSNLLDAPELYAPVEPSTTEQHLQEVLRDQQSRLEEHEKALEDLQYRHETQRFDLVQARRERDDAIMTATSALERMKVTEANSALLRTERTELKEKLEEANRKLLDHSVPERAEFEALRLASEQAKLDKDKAERREQAAQNELRYSRDMYQDCSNRARDLALEKGEVEKQLVEASALAKGEAARVRQISQDTRHKALERENMRLKAMLKDREAGMKFKDEEITRLKEATRGRMGTRQSSVPRSPRIGSPIKGRVGAGSRQASPAAGDVRGGRGGHPLRRSD